MHLKDLLLDYGGLSIWTKTALRSQYHCHETLPLAPWLCPYSRMKNYIIGIQPPQMAIDSIQNKPDTNRCQCCDEPENGLNLNDDTFPSSDQIWGMIGTIFATVACWLVYAKVRIGRNRYQNQQILMHSKPPRAMSTSRKTRTG